MKTELKVSWQLPIEITHVINLLNTAGFKTYVVGGAVRDFLREVEVKDYDLCTTATPEQVTQTLTQHNLIVKPLGQNFGVVLTVCNHRPIEIATLRTEDTSSDHRRPDAVTYTQDPSLDAQRRDFTVNALYYDPSAQTVLDYVGGLKDLESHSLRFIGEPQKRIDEDHLRLLRFVRFACKTGFTPSPNEVEIVQNNATKILTVSAERIHEELNKIFVHKERSLALDFLLKTKLLEQVLPEVAKLRGCNQTAPYHTEGDVYVHTHLALQNLPTNPDPELTWATLFHDLGKVDTRSVDSTGRARFHAHEKFSVQHAKDILTRLKFPKKQARQILWLIAQHDRISLVHEMQKSKVYALLLTPNLSAINPYLDNLLLLQKADSKACKPATQALQDESDADAIKNLTLINSLKEDLNKRTQSNTLPKDLLTGHDLKNLPPLKIKIELLRLRSQILSKQIYSRQEALKLLN